MNTTTSTIDLGTVQFAPDHLNLDPQSVSDVAVQYRVPVAGTYVITGNFVGDDTHENTHGVEVLDNEAQAFSGTISSVGQVAAFDLVETLNADDTITFVVETGSGGVYTDLSTGLAATISPAVTIASGATLTVDTPTASDIAFLGSTGALDLAQPSSFTGEIAGFTGTAANSSSSDVIDLAGINYNSGSFSENYNSMTGVLTVSDGTNSVELTFIDFTGTLKFASDGTGGTDIYDPPATGSCEKSVSIGGPGNDNFVFHPANATDTSVHWNAQQDAGAFDHVADAELGRHLALFITGGDGDAVTEYGYHDASALPDAATTQLQQIAQAHYIHSH